MPVVVPYAAEIFMRDASEIVAVARDGSRSRSLHHFAVPQPNISGMVVDGDGLYWVGAAGASTRLWHLDLNGGEPTPVTAPPDGGGVEALDCTNVVGSDAEFVYCTGSRLRRVAKISGEITAVGDDGNATAGARLRAGRLWWLQGGDVRTIGAWAAPADLSKRVVSSCGRLTMGEGFFLCTSSEVQRYDFDGQQLPSPPLPPDVAGARPLRVLYAATKRIVVQQPVARGPGLSGGINYALVAIDVDTGAALNVACSASSALGTAPEFGGLVADDHQAVWRILDDGVYAASF